MRVVDTIPFARELIGPLHAQSFRRPGAAVRPDEVELGPAWSIARQGDHPNVRAAEEHLSGFLAGSMGAPLSAAGGKPIRLRADESLDANPEVHRVTVSTDGIDIVGAGPIGVLQGVFQLEALIRERGGPFVPVGDTTRRPLFVHRIHRSALSPFYVEELTGFDGPPFDIRSWDLTVRYPAWTEEDAGPGTYYHDNHLLRMLEHGINGIWLRGALREFARVSVFPEFGPRSDAILAALRDLTARAAGFGMKVFLYMNEPMGLPSRSSFWERYPHLAGVPTRHAPIRTMCTSQPETLEYLREGTRYVFDQVPGLAGVILISASEYPSHCYCHQSRPDDPAEQQRLIEEGFLCPRCVSRTPQEVVAEVITSIRDGAKSASPAAEVIAWNWSWSFYEPDPQTGILTRLPEDVIVMGDYERGEPTRALDFDYENDEYSIKVIGPSRRFRGVAEFQQSRGRPVYAKIQIGTTHENPNVPYLPTLHKVAAKFRTLHATGVTGMMMCWNFGNVLSLSTETAREFSWDPAPASIEEGLLRVATRNFGPDAAPDVVAGWDRISHAQDDFPGSIPVMYYGPISRAPSFAFEFDRIDKAFPNSWLLDEDPRGDIVGEWTSPFGGPKVVECYRAVAAGWQEGVDLMRRGLAKARGEDRQRLERELGVAEICRIQLVCSADLIDFLMARDAFIEATDAAERRRLLDRMEALCKDERATAALAIPLCEADSRLGWHGEAYGPMFTRELIEAKLAGLEDILTRRIPEERAKLGG